MSDLSQTQEERDFHCEHCGGRIMIPFSLPPTTAPCPHCQVPTTSPPPPDASLPKAADPKLKSTTGQPASAASSEASFDQSHTKPDYGKKGDKSSKGMLLAVLALFILILAGGGIYYISNKKSNDAAALFVPQKPVTKVKKKAVDRVEISLETDAQDILGKFLAGKSAAEKLPYIINADKLHDKLEKFYGGVAIDDSDTPVSSFTFTDLPGEYREKGMLMMVSKQSEPPEKLVSSTDVTPDTMKGASKLPLQADAFFLKTDQGLKLDWEVFAQSKYRIFRNFLDNQNPGTSEILRVLIFEDIPEKGKDTPGLRTYKMADFAHFGDTAKVVVLPGTELSETLAEINWRGTEMTKPPVKTATVELEWTETANGPELSIKRFICWEFLGLGGKDLTASASPE